MVAQLGKRVSIQDTAHHFGVSDRAVRRWITEGRLTAVRVGPKLIRVDLGEVDALERAVGVGGAV